MADQQDVHELVAMLVADPVNPPDLTVLNGYIGPSTVDKCVRLYRSSAMNIWLDIPEDQIKGRSTIGPTPTSPWGENIIWMRREDARNLDENTSVVGASRDVSAHSEAAGGTRPGTASGTVVNIYLGAGGAVSTRPAPDGGGRPIGGGGVTGPAQLFPPRW